MEKSESCAICGKSIPEDGLFDTVCSVACADALVVTVTSGPPSEAPDGPDYSGRS
jgi:hypothetical protein